MKKVSANYVALNYNSSIGYSLLIQDCKSTSIRATFSHWEDAQEYLTAKAGKIMANRFDVGFKEIKELIVALPDIRREILSKFYVFEGGKIVIK